jgi:hypothetical protein
MLNLADMISVPVPTLTPSQINYTLTLAELDRQRQAGEHVKDWYYASILDAETPPHDYAGDWIWAGGLIEREELEIEPVRADKVNGLGKLTGWRARHPKNYGGLRRYYGYGDTLLIAAMRCILCAKYGDTVNIPREVI